MTDQKIFDLQIRENKLIIKLLREPENTEEGNFFLDLFFQEHKKTLEAVKVKKSVCMLLDIKMLSYSPLNLTYVPALVKHFTSLKKTSNQKLKACAVLVSSSIIATIIQPLIDNDPGEVPTKITTDEKIAKEYLRSYLQTK